jgi:hypothetical protein
LKREVKMLMPRFTFKRTVAALLPFCFLWAFVACLSLCMEHAEEAGDESRSALCLGREDAPASDSCPIVQAPKATLRNRLSLLPADAVALASTGFTRAPINVGASLLDSDDHSSADPPFERLRVLRI